MNVSISGITTNKNGDKVAYVRFEEDKKYAEWTIPDINLCDNEGFTEDEKEQMRWYIKENLLELKKKAAGINPIKAMMKEK